MAVYNCKICGGVLEPEEGNSIAKCPYCGITQTLPLMDEKSVDLINVFASALTPESLGENQEDTRLEIEYREKIAQLKDNSSHCVYASDLQGLIDFFERNIAYKDSERYLCELKYRFAARVSSFEDCVRALKYIDELGDYKDIIYVRADCENKMALYRKKQLIEEGVAVAIPYDYSVKSINASICKYIAARDKLAVNGNYDEYSLDIISKNFKELSEYLNKNIVESINSGEDSFAIELMRTNLLKLNGNGIVIENFQNVLAKIDERVLRLRLNEKRANVKRKFKIYFVICVICAVAISVAAVVATLVWQKTFDENKNTSVYEFVPD